MSRPWETQSLKLAHPKTALIQGGRKKIHATYNGGIEMVEEYDVITDKLLVRKWRKEGQLGGEGSWEYEIGGSTIGSGNEFLQESSKNPLLVRSDDATTFEWRIRNLPYPKDVYKVAVENSEIVVRTTNKKYFKKISIPDMRRLNLPLDNSEVSWKHAHNTLIISYSKPQPVLIQQQKDAAERKNMKVVRLKD
eukprot:TRINITY_DN10454_c4_g1_i1.p1 TRINITY_DN10454_c4_g1~~TRINITY_DN10454_c4_g1_i1.p1  ORF type:complete len:213 (+),score=33.98 TRINITY_DN10454_c4_g1_i1:61-639(+)